MSHIDRFRTGTYKVLRSTDGSYSGGFYVPGAVIETSISGSLQRLSAKDLKMVEEGYRLRQLWRLYSDDPLIPLNTKSLATSDRVIVNGETFRVISCEAWQGLRVDLPYYMSILAREPEQ
jgi:hypothetical protein